MPKQDDKHSMSKDYLARIKWEGEHPYMADGSKPDVPNWKYRPIGRTRSTISPISRIILTIVLLIFLGGLLYLAIVKQEDGAISLTGVLVFIGVLVLVLNLDASKQKRRD